jgi:phage terminase small subunit
MNKLTDKQQKFCDEYLVDLNATQAAIRVGYSEKTASEQSSRLLSNVKIQNYIQNKQKKTSDKLEINKELILQMVFDIAKSKGERTNDRLKAIEIVNKMLGLNEAEKHEVKEMLEQPLFPDVPKNNCDK